MDDRVGTDLIDQSTRPLGVPDVHLDEPAARIAEGLGQIRLLVGPGVERVEIVDDDHLGPIGQEAIDEV